MVSERFGASPSSSNSSSRYRYNRGILWNIDKHYRICAYRRMRSETDWPQYLRAGVNCYTVLNYRNIFATILLGPDSHLLMDQTIDADYRIGVDHHTIRVRKNQSPAYLRC